MAQVASLQNLAPTVSAGTTTQVVTSNTQAVVKAPENYAMMGGAGAAILGFILIFSFIWIILFSFRPTFVRYVERGETVAAADARADPARCFVAALIISLLLVVIVWMFRACK
ncbi:Hypothetical protein POVN_LOCUS414 [uncultured virus]|nr:Hypothetical protein POVN_LOCUS414 [uncultured virus]